MYIILSFFDLAAFGLSSVSSFCALWTLLASCAKEVMLLIPIIRSVYVY